MKLADTPQVTNAIPTFSIDYDLGALATAIGNWVGQFWPLLAFLIAIPLAFYIIELIKNTFVK